MKTSIALIALLTGVLLTLPPAHAQSEGKKKGIFNRIFEAQNDVSSETKKEAEASAKELLESDEAKQAVKEATAALSDQEDADALLKAGMELLKDPDSAISRGQQMAGDKELMKAATQAAAGIDPETLRSASAKLGGTERQALESAAANLTSSGRPQGLSPLRVPAPTNPVATPIPRPNLDPSRITRITAEQAEFDANTNLVTFEDNVELDHPEFDLTCDILEAELKKQSGTGEESAESQTQRAASGGIERATASGYVVIEKLTPEGKTQVAKARRAVYESATGNVVLMIFPQMQDGENLIKGTSEATRIFLRPNGKYNVEGPAEFKLVTPGDSNPLKLKPRD